MAVDAGHHESTVTGEESALEYKSMELEEGRSQWCREDKSGKDIKSTRSRCWRSNVCSVICVTVPLFLILMIMASLKSNQQDIMLRELETKADNMASSLESLQSNLQQTAPHSQQPEYKELTEVKSAVTNLGASITSLSSKLHAEKEEGRMTVLEQSVINLTHSMNELPSGFQNTVGQHDLKLKGLETTINNMSSSLNTILSRLQQTVRQKDAKLQDLETAVNNVASFMDIIPSTLQETVEKEGRRMTVLEQSVTNLTVSVNALSSGLQDTDSQQGTKMQELETAVNNMSSTLDSVASKMQETDEKLMTMLTNLTAKIMGTKRSKDKITYSCTENWELHETSCYLFSSNKLSWHNARDYCKTQSGTLLIINNQDEWNFSIIKPRPEYWIGLTDEITGVWRWVDGTPYVMDKSKWDEGQPDDWKKHGLGGGEDCAHIIWNAKLNDDHCTREYKYICERTASASH